MKHIKYLSIAILCAFSVSLSAQEEATTQEAPVVKKQKKDFSYLLPQKGDFALVIDAAPVLGYVADLVNFSGGNSAQSPGFQAARGFGFMGKYFLSPKLALRANLSIDINNYTQNYNVRDDAEFVKNPNSEAETIDVQKHRQSTFDFGVGTEYRVGKSRVQGYFGGELFVGFNKLKDEYKYGNPISEANKRPSTSFAYDANNARTLYSKADSNFRYGLKAITGIDIFITKNIAIGGEIALKMACQNNGKLLNATEQWEAVQVSVKENIVSPGGSAFSLNFEPVFSLNLSIFF